MIQKDSQTETGEVLLASFDLVTDTSESTRAKTAETFLELLGARVRNPNTRNHGWIGIPGGRSTQRQHLAAIRLLFDSLLIQGVVEYNPAVGGQAAATG